MTRSKNRRLARGRRQSRPVVEGLEARSLMAVTLTQLPTTQGLQLTGGVALGPDGNIWVTQEDNVFGYIGEVNSRTGLVTSYPIAVASRPQSITAGPDGNLWFTQYDNNTGRGAVGYINPTTHAIFEAAYFGLYPGQIVSAPDGRLWFTDDGEPSESGGTHQAIDSIDPKTLGLTSTTLVPNLGNAIAVGPDGNIWFTGYTFPTFHAIIGSLNTATLSVSEFVLMSNGYPIEAQSATAASTLAAGPDGNLWFTLGEDNGVVPPTNQDNFLGDYVATFSPTTHAQSYIPVVSNELLGPIALGPDGNMWFGGYRSSTSGVPMSAIGAINPVTHNSVNFFTGASNVLTAFASGPGNLLWFPSTSSYGNADTIGVASNISLGIGLGDSVLPLTVVANPFGVGNPNLQTAEVKGLYQSVLGRPADPAGLAHWVAQLRAGKSLAQVAAGIIGSAEYDSKLITTYYQRYLARAPYAGEVSAWLAQIQKGLTPAQVAADILGSPEYTALHQDPTDFVQSLYQEVLGRNGTDGEVAAWVYQLHTGLTRANVAVYILDSTEALTRSINGDYLAFLGRPADPAGIQAALALLYRGGTLLDIAIAIAGSPEYIARANASVG